MNVSTLAGIAYQSAIDSVSEKMADSPQIQGVSEAEVQL
jgi:hypothetical protein